MIGADGETGRTRCGSVAVIGAPNAGKSTLVNALVGQKVAIVSPKAQTTRSRLIGLAITGDTQLLLVDTPGIFTPKRRLDRAMVHAAWEGAAEADVILLVIDSRRGLDPAAAAICDGILGRPERKMLALNKVDVTPKERLLALAEEASRRSGAERVFMISALTGEGVGDLLGALADAMPEGPWHFPGDQVSNVTSRLLAAEITREQLYRQLHEELPYASTVEHEVWEERRDGSVAIHQQIVVERESQRAIVLGKGGQRIRAIGEAARAELQSVLERRVHLFLHVKVKPDWTEDRSIFENMGLTWVS
jgi:GTP-binding protein Era